MNRHDARPGPHSLAFVVKKPKNPTLADDRRLIVDFVRRLRRVALHPLALEADDIEATPLPGDLLRKLMHVYMTVTLVHDEPQSMTTPLPDEVQFESLATRVRAFTLQKDRLYWPKALAALDRLTGLDDVAVKISSKHLRDEWHQATDRKDRVRAYFFLVEDEKRQTDVDLAYAWLYQDLAHGDEVSTGHLGVQHRFEAAVGVFAHLAVVAIETLHYINGLCELGIIKLPVGTFSDRVTAFQTGITMKVSSVYEVALDEDLNELTARGPLPDSARPIIDVVKELREQGYGDDARNSPDSTAITYVSHRP